MVFNSAGIVSLKKKLDRQRKGWIGEKPLRIEKVLPLSGALAAFSIVYYNLKTRVTKYRQREIRLIISCKRGECL